MKEQNIMYRIVLTCWERGKDQPYADHVPGFFETDDAAHKALRRCVKDELETLNERPLEDIDVEYPSEIDDFKANFDGDEFDAVVQLWDGDDYRNVTGYNIEKIVALTKRTWVYGKIDEKGVYIYGNKNDNRFKVEVGGEEMCVKHKLESAFDFVDKMILERKNAKRKAILQKCEKTIASVAEAEWVLPVTWEVSGFVKVKAVTLEKAIKRFYETSDHIPLPKDGKYVNGSFSLSCDDEDFIYSYNAANGYRVRKHYEDDMETVYCTRDLTAALEYCFIADGMLCRSNGHALSIWGAKGSIFEITYTGHKEIDVDGVATENELEIIKDYIKKNS